MTFGLSTTCFWRATRASSWSRTVLDCWRHPLCWSLLGITISWESLILLSTNRDKGMTGFWTTRVEERGNIFCLWSVGNISSSITDMRNWCERCCKLLTYQAMLAVFCYNLPGSDSIEEAGGAPSCNPPTRALPGTVCETLKVWQHSHPLNIHYPPCDPPNRIDPILNQGFYWSWKLGVQSNSVACSGAFFSCEIVFFQSRHRFWVALLDLPSSQRRLRHHRST